MRVLFRCPEVDDDIKSLGERFGIPTEFTSYFVREPNIQQPMRTAGMGAAGAGSYAPVAASAPKDVQFEAAKMRSMQRSVSSTVQVDLMAAQAEHRGDM